MILLLMSCGPKRDLVYFSNIESGDLNNPKAIKNVVTSTIQPDDILSIVVNSLSAESNMLFNQGVLGTLGSRVSNSSDNETIEGYLVDEQGEINFPVIGKIKLGGLTTQEATDTIQSILDRDYVKNPIVNIRYLNYQITVLGEVKTPSVYTVATDKVNVLEALSMAGDLTPFGLRNNVLVIRENDGERLLYRVDLNDKELLSNPGYYLQQNDIVYVEPDKIRRVQTSAGRSNTQFVLSIMVTVLTIATLFIALNR
jgi:polysaccharide export outer membrane protein